MAGSGTYGGVTIEWACATHVGNVRKVNEDSALAQPPVFLVADGMGGHEAGDVASSMVVDRFNTLTTGTSTTSEEVVQLVHTANADVFACGSSPSAERSMGTTVVGLAIIDDTNGTSWMLFNVGDSRAYVMDNGLLRQLSVDHSYVQELVDAGKITMASARSHPQKNVVTRAIGVERAVAVDRWIRSPRLGERYLLCSDGLSGEVEESLISDRLSAEVAPEVVVHNLVNDALQAGGRDNVTVIVIDVIGVDEEDDQITAPRDQVVAPITQELMEMSGGEEQRPAPSGSLEGVGFVDDFIPPPSEGESSDGLVAVADDADPTPTATAEDSGMLITGVPAVLPHSGRSGTDSSADSLPVFVMPEPISNADDSDSAASGIDDSDDPSSEAAATENSESDMDQTESDGEVSLDTSAASEPHQVGSARLTATLGEESDAGVSDSSRNTSS